MKALSVGEFEKVASGLWLEGLAIDHQRGVTWFSDVIGGGLYRMAPSGDVETFNPTRMWTGGVLINEDGAALSSGAGGIMWTRAETGESGWLIDQIDGQPIVGVNEMAPDGQGGLYFGTCDLEMIQAGKPPRPSALYRLARDRSVVKVADEIAFANGLMMSPDGQQLYCNNSFVCTYVFDVESDLTLKNRRVLIDKTDSDGLAVDAEGNIWITGFGSSYLTRLRPDGSRLPDVQTPGGAVTQIRFFGQEMRDYYIATVPADGGEALKNGVIPTEKTSVLYRGRSDVPGHPVTPTRFTL